jgi:EmrB/QacA subfamily drug resistance transporter
MVGLDGTVVAIANPYIARDLTASLSDLQWVTNAYLLVLSVGLITAGKLGDRLGRKKVFLIGVVGFAVASLLVGLSGSIGAVIAFRAVQGGFGALLMANTLANLRAAFPPERLETAVGIWGGVTAVAIASGPIVGGLLVEHLSWQWVFYVNIPVALIALLIGLLVIRETADRRGARSFDVPGVLLLSGGLFCLVWGIIKAQSSGWGSVGTLGFVIGGVVLLVAFAVFEHRPRAPLLPPRLFRSRSLTAGTVLVLLTLFALFGVLFFVALYLQNVHGYSAIQAGVRVLPLTATFAVSAPLSGALTARFGPRPPIFIGTLLIGAAFVSLTSLTADASYLHLWPAFIAIGFGMGFVLIASTQAVIGSASVDEAGVASGLQQTATQFGGVLGTAVLGSVMSSTIGGVLVDKLLGAGVPAAATKQITQHLGQVKGQVAEGSLSLPSSVPHDLVGPITSGVHAAFMSGLHNAMWVGAAVAFAGTLLSLVVRPGRVEAPVGTPM